MCIFNTHSVLTKINICWKRAQRFITRHLLWVKLGLCGDVYKKPAVSKYTPPAALRVRALSSAAAWASHAGFFYSKCVFSSSNAGFPFGPVIRAAGTGIKLVKVLWFMCLLSDAVIIIRCFWWERTDTHYLVFLSFPFFFRRFSRTDKDCFTSQRRKHQRFLHLVPNLFIYLLLCFNNWRLVSKIFKMGNQKIPS